mgnify:CR=1 FL=1
MQAHTDIPSVMSSKTLGTISVAIVIQNNITQFLMAILHLKSLIDIEKESRLSALAKAIVETDIYILLEFPTIS